MKMKIIKWIPIKTQIIEKNKIFNSKSITLQYYLYCIRKIEINNLEIIKGYWDSKVKYRRSYGKIFVEYSSSFYIDRDVWNDFILLLEGENYSDYYFNPLSLDTTLYLRTLLKLFWRDIANNLKNSTTFKIQLRVQLKQEYTSNKFTIILRSLSKVQIIKKSDFTDLFKTLMNGLYLLTDEYEEFKISSVILFYSICPEDSILKKTILVLNENKLQWNNTKKIINKNNLKIKHKNLPTTTNLLDWGALSVVVGDYPYKNNKINKIFVKAKLYNTKENSIEILNYFKVWAKKVYFEGKIIVIQKTSVVDSTYKNNYFTFIDIIQDPSKPNSFVRIYDNNQFIFENGKIVYSQKRKKVSYFKTLKKNNFLTDNFITLDLETKTINGVLEPYCASIFDGKKAYSFYITDYDRSSDLLMKAALSFILKRNYNKHKIYIHNFSHFDGIFLLKIISEFADASNIKPIIRDNRIISLKVKFFPEKIKKLNIIM